MYHRDQTTFENFNPLKHFVFGVGLFSSVRGIKPRSSDIEKGVGRFRESNFILDIVISFKTCPDVKMGYKKLMEMNLLKLSEYTWMKNRRGDILQCLAVWKGAL